jgi:type IV pilus assembly protein PilY1
MQTDQSKIKARDLCVLLIGKGKWWLAASVILILAHPAYGISIELDDARPYGSVGTPAVNKSNLVGSGGVLFETCFEPDEFTGDVVARKISSAGVVNHDVSHADGHVKDDPTGGIVEGDNALWRAHEKLRPHDHRIIFTSGYEFQWGDLPEDFQDEIDLEGSVNNHGENVVAWIRGDDSNEGVFAHEFRVRLKKDQAGNEVHYPLGDFVHSAIQYVGPPSKLRADEGYSEFFIANKDRTPVVYAGANDGMLHAFNAETGEELFAYIPKVYFQVWNIYLVKAMHRPIM